MSWLRRFLHGWARASSQTMSSRMLQVLALIPDKSLKGGEGEVARTELEKMIGRAEYTAALAALSYAAWLTESSTSPFPDYAWFVLADLAGELRQPEAVRDYWPSRLAFPREG